MQNTKHYIYYLCFTIAIIAIFIVALHLGKSVGLEQSAVATVLSATALATSALVAFLAFQLNHRNSQEPWLVTFRELHKEFWNDPDMAKVRSWLCCDEAYRNELLPILQKRLSGQVSTSEYGLLESLDRFLALMLRVVYMQSTPMSEEKRIMFKKLNYYWWLHQARSRKEIYSYIELTVENLYPYVRDAKFHDAEW